MDEISFSMGCRNCRETNGKRNVYQYEDEEGQLPLANKSDYGVMRVVELMNTGLGVTCPFCQSTHLDIFDLAVNDQLLFNYEQLCRQGEANGLIVLSLTVDKSLNMDRTSSQLDLHMVANPSEVPTGFLVMALDCMAGMINERPAYDFAFDTTGQSYLCVAGRWADDEQKRVILPQKYTCRGLTKEEILFVIDSAKSGYC